jgi:hypothetical protein
LKSNSSKKSLLLAGYFLGLLFNPEDGGSTFLRNVTEFPIDYAVSSQKIFVVFSTI